MENFSPRGRGNDRNDRRGRSGRNDRNNRRERIDRNDWNEGSDRSSRNDNFGNRNFGGGFNRGPARSFKGVCDDCKADCDLPFKPVEGRPVYCRNCFPKHKKTNF